MDTELKPEQAPSVEQQIFDMRSDSIERMLLAYRQSQEKKLENGPDKKVDISILRIDDALEAITNKRDIGPGIELIKTFIKEKDQTEPDETSRGIGLYAEETISAADEELKNGVSMLRPGEAQVFRAHINKVKEGSITEKDTLDAIKALEEKLSRLEAEEKKSGKILKAKPIEESTEVKFEKDENEAKEDVAAARKNSAINFLRKFIKVRKEEIAEVEAKIEELPDGKEKQGKETRKRILEEQTGQMEDALKSIEEQDDLESGLNFINKVIIADRTKVIKEAINARAVDESGNLNPRIFDYINEAIGSLIENAEYGVVPRKGELKIFENYLKIIKNKSEKDATKARAEKLEKQIQELKALVEEVLPKGTAVLKEKLPQKDKPEAAPGTEKKDERKTSSDADVDELIKGVINPIAGPDAEKKAKPDEVDELIKGVVIGEVPMPPKPLERIGEEDVGRFVKSVKESLEAKKQNKVEFLDLQGKPAEKELSPQELEIILPVLRKHDFSSFLSPKLENGGVNNFNYSEINRIANALWIEYNAGLPEDEKQKIREVILSLAGLVCGGGIEEIKNRTSKSLFLKTGTKNVAEYTSFVRSEAIENKIGELGLKLDEEGKLPKAPFLSGRLVKDEIAGLAGLGLTAQEIRKTRVGNAFCSIPGQGPMKPETFEKKVQEGINNLLEKQWVKNKINGEDETMRLIFTELHKKATIQPETPAQPETGKAETEAEKLTKELIKETWGKSVDKNISDFDLKDNLKYISKLFKELLEGRDLMEEAKTGSKYGYDPEVGPADYSRNPVLIEAVRGINKKMSDQQISERLWSLWETEDEAYRKRLAELVKKALAEKGIVKLEKAE